jgi:hypothetical protein
LKPLRCIEELRIAVRSFYDVQKTRIEMEGRLRPTGKERLLLDAHWQAVLKERLQQFQALEKALLKDVEKLLEEFPAASWLLAERGCGPTLAGVIIAEYADPSRANTVSQMWSFAGLNVLDTNEAPGLKNIKRLIDEMAARGEKKRRPWNAFLRTKLLGVLGPNLLKAANARRKDYDDYKRRVLHRQLLVGKELMGAKWYEEVSALVQIVEVDSREKSVDGERAVPSEKSAVAERAELEETPADLERAVSGEKPRSRERAVAGEKTKRIERAASREKTAARKRAASLETPDVRERAIGDENPDGAERADDVEQPDQRERAASQEKPAAVERAALDEKTALRERAKHDSKLNRLLEKARKETEGRVWNKAHIHQAAIRFMVKGFVRDFYPVWRTCSGLPVRAPYHEEKLGHAHGG